MFVVNLLFILPLVFAFIYFLKPHFIAVLIFVSVLITLAFLLLFIQTPVSFSFTAPLHLLFLLVDFLLLFYFLYEGKRQKHAAISFFALVQLLLLAGYKIFAQTPQVIDIEMQRLSVVMLLVINTIGGLILIYALEYIKSEAVSKVKKRFFIAMLFFFIGVMNFLVCINSLELFFLAFELTTLCSYLLIRFRGDSHSIAMAQRALWVNQLGGVFILLALIYGSFYEIGSFSTLLQSPLMPVLVLLTFAAFVKGAQLPFNSWLLGAMAAPTPVSAILHSATMVKIAPFLVLKLHSGYDFTTSLLIGLFGTFVFVAASLFAFSKDYIKEILGYSTIGLLGLMIALAAFGFVQAVLILIVFHAISKGLLFLQAGVLEKEHDIKYLSQIRGLANVSPLFVWGMIFAFASLVVPPFGVFSGKFLAIVSFASLIESSALMVVVLLFSILGSVLLTLLYFRVISNLYAQKSDSTMTTTLPKIYSFVLGFFVLLLLLGTINAFFVFKNYEVFVALFVVLAALAVVFAKFFKNSDRVKVYHCGEKQEAFINSFYFDFESFLAKKAIYFTLFMMGLMAVWGLYV